MDVKRRGEEERMLFNVRSGERVALYKYRDRVVLNLYRSALKDTDKTEGTIQCQHPLSFINRDYALRDEVGLNVLA